MVKRVPGFGALFYCPRIKFPSIIKQTKYSEAKFLQTIRVTKTSKKLYFFLDLLSYK